MTMNERYLYNIDSKILYSILEGMVQDLLAKKFRSIVIERYQPEIETQVFSNLPSSYICEVHEYQSSLDKLLYNDLLGNKSKRPTKAMFKPIFCVSEVVVCGLHSNKTQHSGVIVINSKDIEMEALAKQHLDPISRLYNAKIYSTIGF